MTASPASPPAASPPPRRSRKAFVWFLVATLLCVAAALTAVLREAGGDSHNLIARATLVVPQTVWRPGGGLGYDTNSAILRWKNNHEIVRVGWNTSRIEPVVLDTQTGKTRTIPIAGLLLPRRDNPVAFSPNGEWLLCENRSMMPPYYFAVALDGSRRRRDWPGPSYGAQAVVWFADSRRFMTVLFDTSKSVYVARVFSVDAPGVSKPIRLSGVRWGGSGIVGALPSRRFLASGGLPASGRSRTKTVSSGRETLTEFGVDRDAAPPRVLTIAAPSSAPLGVSGTGGATVLRHRSLRVSPQGDRVLWVVSTFDYSPPFGSGGKVGRRLYPFLERVLPRVFARSRTIRYQYELATARLDGRGGVTRLGSVTPPTRANAGGGGVTYGFIGDWSWTPDGKRVSFTYDRALYTIPVLNNAP